MGGKWSIEARNLDDKMWQVCDYNVPGWKLLAKAVLCMLRYDVVNVGKHGR